MTYQAHICYFIAKRKKDKKKGKNRPSKYKMEKIFSS